MKYLQSSNPTRLAAALAISAGILTGAFWPVGQPLPETASLGVANDQIDPAIPVLTIVAKKLSVAEKRQLADETQPAANLGMLAVSRTDARPTTANQAF
jgi:hypothetical protein